MSGHLMIESDRIEMDEDGETLYVKSTLAFLNVEEPSPFITLWSLEDNN